MQEATNAILQMRFPQKLWYLLNLHTDAILWGGTGRTILLNYRVLQHYLKCDHSIFKTTNISSFIRQLNLYGFRKVTSHLQDPLCNSSNPYMHEFIHDNFQYGRPELLNKITRKALTMKRGFKPKNFENSDQIIYISPLQKARRALRLALKKAAQDLLVLNSSKDCNSQYVDSTDDYCEEEENIEFDWLITDNVNMEHQKEFTKSGLFLFPFLNITLSLQIPFLIFFINVLLNPIQTLFKVSMKTQALQTMGTCHKMVFWIFLETWTHATQTMKIFQLNFLVCQILMNLLKRNLMLNY
nr:heat shock factor protein-like [Vanessa tameamea]